MFERARIVRAIACALVVAIASTSPTVAADAAGRAGQQVRGEVSVPAGPHRAGRVIIDACGFVGATTRWAAGRRLAYEFDVDPRTYGRPFVVSTNAPADVDVVFFDDYRIVGASTDRALGTERGRVSKGADRAAVCLVAGPPTRFLYRSS